MKRQDIDKAFVKAWKRKAISGFASSSEAEFVRQVAQDFFTLGILEGEGRQI